MSEEARLGPAKPGPETEAIKKFFPDGAKVTWTGTVKEGGMGPGSPEMEAKGKGTVKWIMDGLWAVLDCEQDQFVAGNKVLTWKAHFVVGWDFWAKAYRAVVADSNGSTARFNCEIDGDKLIMIADAILMGQPAKLRIIQDHTNPQAVAWKNEFSVNNGPWILIEEYKVKQE